jgi:branched-chain amino acid transport system ATP-binding protein
MSDPILATQGLSRRFGGLAAVSDVSLELHRGCLHAVLGPNGAGKSTLINLLSGDLPATRGSIHYRGRDVTALGADRRSRMGIGRSYQKTNIFGEFTAFENCRLASQSRQQRPLAVLSDARACLPVRERAERALEAAGLVGRGDHVAAKLSHGEQRQLEVAMVLATEPEVLLLDEPLAGMGPDESRRMVALMKSLAPHHAMLLVEHDMDAVFEVADVITVMVNGQVLESGAPAQIRASAAVREAYLGGEHALAEDGAPGGVPPPAGAGVRP